MAYVQRAYTATGSGAGSLQMSFPGAVTSGNLITVMEWGTDVASITDDQGNTYQRVGPALDGSFEFWYAWNVTGASTLTITVTRNVHGWFWYTQACEWSDVISSSDPLWDTASASGSPGSPYDFPIGTVDVPTDNALVVIPAYTGSTIINESPTNTGSVHAYTCRWIWYYLQETAGSYYGEFNAGPSNCQGYIAVFLGEEVPAGDARITQAPVEALLSDTDGSTHVSQGAVEALMDEATITVRLSQSVIEVLITGTTGEAPPPDEPIILEGPPYSSVDLPDPSTYYGGFKDGRILSFGTATRTLSDLTGQWSANDLTCTLADTDRTVRRVLQLAKGLRETPAIVRMISDADRRALATPTVVFRGALRAWRPRGDLAVELEYTDAVGLKLARREKDRMLPQRTLTATDFPNIPAENLNKPVPIIYGTHERLTGACPVIYVGMWNHAGFNTHTWVVAGHACKGVTGIFLDGVEDNWAEFYAYGRPSGWPTDLAYVDVNGRRYTIIQGIGPNADAAAAGTMTLAVNVNGVEVDGDGRAMLITQSFLQYLHFFRHFVLDNYQGGLWPETPIEWETGWCQINAQSFVTAQQETIRYIGDVGYVGQAYIGPETRSVRDWLAVWNTSLNCRLGLNRYHQWVVSILPATLTPESLAALPRISDQQDVLRGSLSIEALDNEAITRATVRAYRVPYESDVFSGAETYVDTLAETDSGVEILANLDLDFMSTAVQTTPLPSDLSASSEDVAKRWIGMRSAAPIYRVTFDAGLCAYETIDVGDLFRLTHFAGVNVAGWTDRTIWCESVALDIDRRVATFTGLDVTHVYEGARTLDELIGDEIITPPPPPPPPDPVAAWGFFDCNAAESGGENVVDGDTVTLGTQTYTFKNTLGSPNDVLVGAINDDSVWNLVCAINAGDGEGTLYGTGTTANADATAGYFGRPQPPPGGVVQGGLWVEAKVAGDAGNSIVWTETSSHARCFHEGNIEWGHLAGGSD